MDWYLFWGSIEYGSKVMEPPLQCQMGRMTLFDKKEKRLQKPQPSNFIADWMKINRRDRPFRGARGALVLR